MARLLPQFYQRHPQYMAGLGRAVGRNGHAGRCLRPTIVTLIQARHGQEKVRQRQVQGIPCEGCLTMLHGHWPILLLQRQAGEFHLRRSELPV
jgi:hypothetical protein